MSKDKKRNIDEELVQKETVLYFDIIGSLLIIVALITFGKFGEIGSLISNLIKIIFGDFYWIFVLFILFDGSYLLFFHNKIDFSNSRIIGVLLITLSLLIFSHFPIHDYLVNFLDEGSYISLLINFYKDSFNGINISSMGGGLLGGLIFYAFYYLFGSVGVIIICIVIILLSVSLIIKKPILSVVVNGAGKLKYIRKYIKKFNNFFKYEFGRNTEEIKDIVLFNKKVPLKLLNDLDNEILFKMQESSSLELNNIIKCVLKNFNLSFECKDALISYDISTFTYIIYDKLQNDFIKQIINKILEVIEKDFLYSYENDFKYDVMTIQINNEMDITLTLKNLLLKSFNNNLNILPLGINFDNTVYEIDNSTNNSYLLVGDYNSGIQSFCNQNIIKYLIKFGLCDCDFYVFDSLKKFNIFDPFIKIYYDCMTLFDDLISIIEDRLNIFKKEEVLNYGEYINKISKDDRQDEYMKRLIIYIDEIDSKESDYIYLENKLIYINQLGISCGIEVYYVVRKIELLTSQILSSFNCKLIFKTSKEISMKILNNENGFYLHKKGDILVCYKNTSSRVKLPYVSVDEIKKINKYILKK